jgi:hypothetical protein
MTQLKSSEKRLLILFGAAAFLLLNLFGFSWWKKRTLTLSSKAIKLEARARELEVMKGLAPQAELKRAYLDAHLQAYPDEATRETYLDQFIQKQVRDLDLEIRKNQPMNAKLEEHFHKSRYTAEVSGEWADILEFIRRLQSPKEFHFVPSLRLKSQKKEGGSEEGTNAVCTFEIEKWWSPQSSLPEEEAAPPEPAGGSTASPPAVAAPATVDAVPNVPNPPGPPKTAATEQTAAPVVETP